MPRRFGVLATLSSAVAALVLSGCSTPSGVGPTHKPAPRGFSIAQEAGTSASAPASSPPTGSVPPSSASQGNTPVTGDSSPLTAAIAQNVFDTSWPQFALDFAIGNTSGLAQFATTDVQHAVQGWFDCGCGPWPTAYQGVNMTAPPENAYPLSFLAEVQEHDYSQQPMVVEVVFSQSTASAPWLISYVVSYIDGSPLLTGTTMDSVPRATSTDVAAVGGQIANFFQSTFDTGTPPNTWPQTGAIQQETQRILSGRATNGQDNFTEDLHYTAGPHSVAFATPYGPFMCGEVRSHSVTTSATNAPIVQSASYAPFGPQLQPGSYSSVASDSLRDVCWGVSIDGSTHPISLFGGIYSRVGTPN